MIVYLTTNLVNGKQYIGQTIRDDKNYLGSGIYLTRAIEKYGKENFKRITLRKCNSIEELNEQEIFWIDVLNTVTPNGYNLKTGGGAGSEYSEKSKQLMSEAKKGKPHTEEHKRKLSEKKQGENNPLYGKRGKDNPNYGSHRTEQTKQQMSGARKGEKNPMFGKKGKDNPNYGKHPSEETRKRIGESHLGKPLEKRGHKSNCQCCICKAKRGETKGENASHYNKPHTEEAKQKMSKARKGTHLSEKTKQLMSRSHKGAPLSEYHKRKMRDAWAKRKDKEGK